MHKDCIQQRLRLIRRVQLLETAQDVFGDWAAAASMKCLHWHAWYLRCSHYLAGSIADGINLMYLNLVGQQNVFEVEVERLHWVHYEELMKSNDKRFLRNSSLPRCGHCQLMKWSRDSYDCSRRSPN